jgi:predicted Zn-dependent peptidase
MLRGTFLALVLFSTAPSAAVAGEMTYDVTDLNFPSGFRVLLLEDHRFPVVRMVTAFGSGAGSSPADKAELAHTVEHMWFRARVDAQETFARLQAMGCAFNGYTGLDTTRYLNQCPRRMRHEQLKLHLGLLDGAIEDVPEGALEIEKRVVTQEWRINDDDFFRPLFRSSRHLLFPTNHPYHLPDLTEGVVSAITEADVAAFVAEHYRLNNAVLVVHGDLSASELLDLLVVHAPPTLFHPDLTEDHLSAFPGVQMDWSGHPAETMVRWYSEPGAPAKPLAITTAVAVRQVYDEPPDPPPSEVLDLPTATTHPAVAAAWSLPSVDAFSYWPMENVGVFATWEADEVMKKLSGVRDTACTSIAGREASTLICWTFHDDDLTEAQRLKLLDKLRGAFDAPWTPAREGRAMVVAQEMDPSWARQEERDSGSLDLSDGMAVHLVYTAHPLYFDRRYSQKDSAFVGFFRRMVGLLAEERSVGMTLSPRAVDGLSEASLGRFGGGVGAGDHGAVEVDEEHEPVSPAIDGREEVDLSNGAVLTLVKVAGVLSASHGAVFPNPPGYPEALPAYVDRYMMRPGKDKGQGWSSWTRMSTQADYSVARVEVRTNLVQLPSWYYRYYKSRDFEEEYYELILAGLKDRVARREPRKVGSADLADWKESLIPNWRRAAYWADEWLYRRLTGKTDALGLTPDDIDEVRKLDEEEIEAYMNAKYRPENADLFVSGQFKYDDALREMRKLFRKWQVPGEAPSTAPTPTAQTPEPAAIVFKATEGAKLAELVVACPLTIAERPRGERAVAYEVLGEVASQLAWDRLRRRSGATYGAGGWAIESSDGAQLRLSTSVNLPDLAATLKEITGLHLELAGGTVDPGMLDVAQRMAADGMRNTLDSSRGTTGFLVQALGEGRGLGVFDRYLEVVDGVDAAMISGMMQGCAGHEQVVVTGPQEEVAGVLEGLGYKVERADWKELFLARVGKWFPAKVAKEKERL